MQTKSVLEETSKTIRISFKTYKQLSDLGAFGDSFDSIIRNLLLDHEKRVQEVIDKWPSRPAPGFLDLSFDPDLRIRSSLDLRPKRFNDYEY